MAWRQMQKHPEGEHSETLPWFDRRDKDFAELQKVIVNPELLESFSYYTRFRHTGEIECANSLSLMYAPKRVPFSYRVYKARKQLGAIDWNYHLNIPIAKSKSGEDRTTRRYNRRTRQWDLKNVKVQKRYEYIPIMMSKILNHRMYDQEGVACPVPLNASDPGNNAPTIAPTPAPATKDIPQRKSRFQ
ncbi:uncharacterized protein LOC114527380 [Dendronephthya gigantea]|uniref:uncharacterized protein LOC114527380 n=1 Tax=Dendronephthya gigantea TaxID=151771 RepID=UPI001069E89D|nr:uncharacterized protein LOC114527380 [Dendronephthya gigantea]